MKRSEKLRKNWNIWKKRISAALACIVVFVTVYAMVLPAITLDARTAGKEKGFFLRTMEGNQDDIPDFIPGDGDDEESENGTVVLTVRGTDYTVTASFDSEGVLPADVSLEVDEIDKDSDEYDTYCGKALEAVSGDEADKTRIQYARFFDISFFSNGKEVEPEGPVSIVIEYDDEKELSTESADEVNVVHFEQTENEEEPVILDITTEENNGQVESISFESDGFSVYGVVGTYTVDFEYEVDGKTYSLSIPGGGNITLGSLLLALNITDSAMEDAKADMSEFLRKVEKVEFTDPDLVWVGKAEQDTTVGNLKAAYQLVPEYSREMTQDQIDEIDSLEVSEGDWAIISLKPFTTQETLTVSMKDGSVFNVNVTDAQGGAINWNLRYVNVTFKINYVDTDGNSLTPGSPINHSSNGTSENFSLSGLGYDQALTGYTFKEFTYQGNKITDIKADRYQEGYNSYWYDIYFKNGDENVANPWGYDNYGYSSPEYEINAVYEKDSSSGSDDPQGQEVILRLNYKNEDGTAITDPVNVPVTATLEGTVVNLSDSAYQKSFDEKTFKELTCYEKKDFDSVKVRLQESGGEYIPVCFFMKDGEELPGGYSFDGAPLDMTYTYSGSDQPASENMITLRIHYLNETGEMDTAEFQVQATAEGNRVYVKAEPYLKYFANYQFQNTKCYDYEGFDTVEFSLNNGEPVCSFISNGVYQTHGSYSGYSLDDNLIDIEMLYTPVDNNINLKLHHFYTNNDVTEKIADDETVQISVDNNEPQTINLRDYIKDGFAGIRFAGTTCTLADGRKVTEFDSIRISETSDGKIYELFQGENRIAYSSVVGDIEINYMYVDEENHSGSWAGGGQRPGGGTRPLPEPDLGELPDARASKTLEPNGDGTYTLTLKMEVPKLEAQASNRANVVVVFDSSNSMHEPIPGNTWERDDRHGTYAEYNGKYYPLVSIGSNVRKVFSFTDDNGVQHTLGSDQPNDDKYCGPKYSPTKTRMTRAKVATKSLGEQFLAMNENGDSDAVEIAFVEFASDIINVYQPTTDYTTFENWVNNCKTNFEKTQNGGDAYGGTNWQAALQAASGRTWYQHNDVVQFSDDDPKYIIFITDGNPTARTSPYYDAETDDLVPDSEEYEAQANGWTDGKRITTGSLLGDVLPGVYGQGFTDLEGHNFNCAEVIARQIVDDDKSRLYNIGIFGDADRIAGLSNTNHFEAGYELSDMEEIFGKIISQVKASMGYSYLSIMDGITSMTSSTLVHGDPKDFQYKVTVPDPDNPGQILDKTDEYLPMSKRNAQYNPSADPKEAGTVTWELGGDDLLLPGGTYSVSFIVWPSQDAYDLVSDLNNGIRTWADLNDVERAQVVGTGENKDEPPYSLKTNTKQEITYSTAKVVTDSDGNKKVTPGETRTAELEDPDPMPLEVTKVNVEKRWNDSLDQTELDDFLNDPKNKDYKVDLDLMKEQSVYIEDILIEPVAGSRVWPDSLHPDGHYISEGLMVSEEAAAESQIAVKNPQGVPYYPTTEFGGKTYYILERGHDYKFKEDVLDYHFELEDKKFHPMVVDGVKMDVTFKDGSNEIMEMVDFETTLTALNSIKGGINLNKIAYDSDGTTEINGERFTVHGSFSPGVQLEYRRYGAEYTDETGSQGRSPKVTISAEDSRDFTIEVVSGEPIRFVNVPSGQDYSFWEELPDGSVYKLDRIDGTITIKQTDSQGHILTDDGGQPVTVTTDMSVEEDDENGLTVSSTTTVNAQQDITFYNRKQTGSIELTKNVTLDGMTTRTDKVDGDYWFQILDQENRPAAGKVNGISMEDGRVKITITGGVSSTVTVTDLPEGVYHIVEDVPANGSQMTDGSVINPEGSQAEAGSVDLSARTIGNIVVENQETTKAAFTNNKSSRDLFAETEVKVSKEWLDKDGHPITGESDLASKSIIYRITQKRAEVTTSFPLEVNTYTFDGQLISTEIYSVETGKTPYITVNKSGQSGTGSGQTRISWSVGGGTETVFTPDTESGTNAYEAVNNGIMTKEAVVNVRPVAEGIDLTGVTVLADNTELSAMPAPAAESYVDAVSQTGINWSEAGAADATLSGRTETISLELDGKTYSAVNDSWISVIGKLPLYQRVDDTFYVYQYEVIEVKADGQDVTQTGNGSTGSSETYNVSYDTSTPGEVLITNKVRNNAPELPSTGGAGTGVFTIFGSMLILFAGLLMWRIYRPN